ncbi:MAG: CHAD domain-containing protein [Rhizobiaceae bacterium]
MTVEASFREILRECVDQIAANIEVVWISDNPEGPHQLRIGLRRLRTIFTIFAAVVRSDELERLDAETRWLARQVGELRDLDVVWHDILGVEIERHPDEVGLPPLSATISLEAAARRETLCATLVTPRTQALLLDLVNFVETRGWLASTNLTQTMQLAMPVRGFAASAIEKRWRKVGKRGRQFKQLGIEQRHELRKELKKLRYTIEFFASLFEAKGMKRMIGRLKRLQTIFGALNDAQMARGIIERQGFAHAAEASTQRAVGWVLGASDARAEIAWRDARKQFRKFKDAGPFWR